jgi:hypothetical protein
VNYNKVYNTGMTNNIGYLSADMELVTLKYQFFDKTAVPLCSNSITSTSGVACPGDGSYQFSSTYSLPSAGSENQSWLASGWQGKGTIRIYAAANENMLIGECTFSLNTMVTPSTQANFYSRTVNPPSAAASVGIIAGALAVLGLVCLWCYCCKRKSRTVVDESDVPKTVSHGNPDDVSAFFKRLDDETGSLPATTRSTTSTTALMHSKKAKKDAPSVNVPTKKVGTRFFGALKMNKKKTDQSVVSELPTTQW